MNKIVANLRKRLAELHRDEARLHLELAHALEVTVVEPTALETSVPSVPKKPRGVTRLPSGNYRMRVYWRGKQIGSVHPTEAAAHTARVNLLDEIASGRRGSKRSGKSVCGIRPFRSWPSIGGVYFAAIPGLERVKIGTAIDIARRLGELRYNVPDLVLLAHVPGGRAEEAEMHRRFAPLRVEGEWFKLEDDLLDHIRMLRKP